MTDATFAAAMTNVQAYLRAAKAAGHAGDPGAVSAELVQAALAIGVQLGQLQATYGSGYVQTRQNQTLTRALRDLQTTAIQAFAQAEQHREFIPAEPQNEGGGLSVDFTTPYDGPGYGE